MNFGYKLKQLRDHHGFSQKDVAERLGIDKTTYSRWEAGEGNNKWEVLPKMADLYK